MNSDLVVRDDNGQIYTVRYDAANAMLLNEFLKEHRKVEEQQTTIGELKSTIARQEENLQSFAAQLKEQSARINTVATRVESTQAAPRVVENR